MSVPYDSAPVARGAKPCSFKRSPTVHETKRFVDRQVGSSCDAVTHDRWDKHIAEAEAPREAGLRIIRMIEALKESAYCTREHDDFRTTQTPNTNLAAEVERARQDRLQIYGRPVIWRENNADSTGGQRCGESGSSNGGQRYGERVQI